jgi:hypothetical protein
VLSTTNVTVAVHARSRTLRRPGFHDPALRPSITSGLVTTATTYGAGAAAIRPSGGGDEKVRVHERYPRRQQDPHRWEPATSQPVGALLPTLYSKVGGHTRYRIPLSHTRRWGPTEADRPTAACTHPDRL